MLGVFALGTVTVLFVSRQQFLRDAQDNVTRQSALIMESALAVRGYTTARIKPHPPHRYRWVRVQSTAGTWSVWRRLV